MVSLRTTSTRRPTRRRLEIEPLEGRIALSLGLESPVNVKTLNNQFDAATASSFTGRSVIVWTDVKAGADTDIRARLFDAAGNPVGGDIIVNNTAAIDSQPTVAMDVAGEFVVAWTRDLPGGNRDVRAARFSAAGVNLGGFNSSIPVATSFAPEFDPSIAVNFIGDFVVSYTVDTSPLNSNLDVRAKMFKDTGAFLLEIPVATSPNLKESHSSVARILDGRFDIAYQQDGGPTNSDVLLRRYSPVGGLLGVNTIAGTAVDEQLPSVSMDEAGNGVVAYQKRGLFNFDIKAKRFTSFGAVGPEINIANGPLNETVPSVAVAHGGGKFVVAFQESGIISNVRVSEVSAANVVVFSTAQAKRARPSVSIDAFARYQVAYQTTPPDSDGSGSGIRRRRGLL
jgi:hypothetical protein